MDIDFIVLITIGLVGYVMFIVFIVTRRLYHAYASKLGDRRMRYFNRKIIHILARGIVALLVPYIYRDPSIPFIMGLLLTLLVLIPYIKGDILYWFQVPDNMYDVNFCIAWGFMFLISWII
jgi:hypothetical protein